MKNNKYVRTLTEKWWFIIATLVSSQILYLIMMFHTFPYLSKESNHLLPLDMRASGYSVNDVELFLSTISDKGRDFYINVQLPLDMVYPLLFSLFCILILSKLTRGKNAVLSLAALLIVFIDYAENLCIYLLLKMDSVSSDLVSWSSVLTITKNIVYNAFLIIILFLMLKNIVSFVRNKITLKSQS